MENEKIRYHFNDRIKAPCKDCKERYLNCHDKCEKYKSYRLELKKAKEAYNKSINREIEAMLIERTRKKVREKKFKGIYKMKGLWTVYIANCVCMICWTTLAIVFEHWEIAVIAIFFMSGVDVEKNKEGDENKWNR